MTYIAAGALAVILLMVLVNYRQQLSHQIQQRLAENAWWKERTEMLERAMLERKSLLDRIQHPTYHQPTEPIFYPQPPPPKDMEELGFVGGVVPDFYKVGHSDDEVIDDVNS